MNAIFDIKFLFCLLAENFVRISAAQFPNGVFVVSFCFSFAPKERMATAGAVLPVVSCCSWTGLED